MHAFVENRGGGPAGKATVAATTPRFARGPPDRPRVAPNLALSIAVGTPLGRTAVILMEILDRRVRSAAELQGGWNVPLLGVLGERRSAEGARLGRQDGSRRALPSPG